MKMSPLLGGGFFRFGFSRYGFLAAVALAGLAWHSDVRADGTADRDCPEDACIPFTGLYSECVELEFGRPELPDRPPGANAEWVTDDSGQQVAEARESDNGTGDDEMADPEVSADGENATVCIYNVGYLTDSSNLLYDLVPWACLEIYVRFQYRYPIRRYVYKILKDFEGNKERILDYSYLDWKYEWIDTCVSQVCLCPAEPEDGE